MLYENNYVGCTFLFIVAHYLFWNIPNVGICCLPDDVCRGKENKKMKLHSLKSYFHFSFVSILQKRDRNPSVSGSHQCVCDSFVHVNLPAGSRCRYTAIISRVRFQRLKSLLLLIQNFLSVDNQQNASCQNMLPLIYCLTWKCEQPCAFIKVKRTLCSG